MKILLTLVLLTASMTAVGDWLKKVRCSSRCTQAKTMNSITGGAGVAGPGANTDVSNVVIAVAAMLASTTGAPSTASIRLSG